MPPSNALAAAVIAATLLMAAGIGCSVDHMPVAEAAAMIGPEPVEAEPAVPLAPAPVPLTPLAIPKAASLELTFVGDVVLGRYLSSERYAEMHPPEDDPFFAVRDQLAADVVAGNLESPVMFTLPDRSPSRNRNRFAGSAAHVEQLANAGFTVMTLANNHFFNLGVDGQLESPRALADAGLFAVGASRVEGPLIRVETLETQGWRIGFIAFATRRNDRGDPDGPQLPILALHRLDDEVIPLIREAQSSHDLIVVTVHWGDEYVDDPGASRRLASHQLLEAGVDLLIGHHPHVLQAIERHPSGDGRDGLIAYSLGNFLFPRGDHPPGLSAVLRVRYRDGVAGARPCLEQARVHPVVSVRQPRWYPRAATGSSAAKVRNRLVPLSRQTNTRWEREGEAGEVDRGEDLLVTGLRACPSPEIRRDPDELGPFRAKPKFAPHSGRDRVSSPPMQFARLVCLTAGSVLVLGSALACSATP